MLSATFYVTAIILCYIKNILKYAIAYYILKANFLTNTPV